MPVRAEDGILSGPGVFDMKGGIVQALFAVRASRELGLDLPAEPVLFLVSDEETGSRNSKERTIGLAAEASRVFVMEPSFGPDGLLKTARKGIGSFRITIKGVASHAGLDPEAGVSAILEASHQIERIFSLNDPERGITVNVGTIDGGLRPNVVAPEAKAEVEARVFSVADAEEVEGTLMGLEPTREGIEIEVKGGFGRSPTSTILSPWLNIASTRQSSHILSISVRPSAWNMLWPDSLLITFSIDLVVPKALPQLVQWKGSSSITSSVAMALSDRLN